MRKSTLIAAPLLAFAAASLGSSPALAAPKLTGEQELAKMLEGRVAGKPVSCISLQDTRDMTVIDHTAIVYGFGQVLYVNRPKDASLVDSSKIMVTKNSTGQLCNVDIVNLRDQTGFTFAGTLSLGDFVPYTRAPKPAASGGN